MKYEKVGVYENQATYKVHTGEFYKDKEKCAIIFGKEDLDDFLANPTIVSNEEINKILSKKKQCDR